MTVHDIPQSRAEADALDAADPLADRRALFDLPDGVIYLDGNSLGPPPRAALEALAQTASRDWAAGLIRSWNDAGWIDWPSAIGARIARLIGASPEDVLIADSVSVNLFKLAMALAPALGSRFIVVETDDFPTDQYIAERAAVLLGIAFRRAAPGEGAVLAREGGLLIRSVVNYRTAAVADIAADEAASGDGAILWDLSHASGVIDLDLDAAGAKAATGCTYKFLNGGPGAPAFLWVSSDLARSLATPLPGWMGHAAPFDFSGYYAPAEGVRRFAAGTPPILSLAALKGALDAFDGVRLADLEMKARRLGDLCLNRASALGLESIAPPVGTRRGGHVCLRHEHGYAIVQALIDRGVIGDFRAPDLMRFGFSPLFIRYTDVWDAMDALGEVLASGVYREDRFSRRARVT